MFSEWLVAVWWPNLWHLNSKVYCPLDSTVTQPLNNKIYTTCQKHSHTDILNELLTALWHKFIRVRPCRQNTLYLYHISMWQQESKKTYNFLLKARALHRKRKRKSAMFELLLTHLAFLHSGFVSLLG